MIRAITVSGRRSAASQRSMLKVPLVWGAVLDGHAQERRRSAVGRVPAVRWHAMAEVLFLGDVRHHHRLSAGDHLLEQLPRGLPVVGRRFMAGDTPPNAITAM